MEAGWPHQLGEVDVATPGIDGAEPALANRAAHPDRTGTWVPPAVAEPTYQGGALVADTFVPRDRVNRHHPLAAFTRVKI